MSFRFNLHAVFIIVGLTVIHAKLHFTGSETTKTEVRLPAHPFGK